jgi:hypothetical protein
MQKSIFVGTLQACHGQNKKEVSNGQIVAYRSGNNLHLQNADFPDLIQFDAVNGEIVIKIKINDGDCLVFQDRTGIAEKRIIQK